MGYCTEDDVTKIMAQALTTATSATTDNLGIAFNTGMRV